MLRQRLKSMVRKIQTAPKEKIIGGTAVVMAAVYAFLIVVPRPVEFSFAADTCINKLTFMPNTYKTNPKSTYDVSFSGGVKDILATKVCFEPKQAPTQSSSRVTTAPWGLSFLGSRYSVKAGEPPKVLMSSTDKKSVAITKPLLYTISQPDHIFTYQLKAADKTQVCDVNDKTLACNLDKLSLKQGEEYTVELIRTFDGQNAGSITKSQIAILPAVTLTEASVKSADIVYTKPIEFIFKTDKPVLSATAELLETSGDTKTPVEAKTTTKDNVITVALSGELPREKAFQLTLKSVEAVDGSTLIDPHVVDFTTSGGPKVAGVSVGTSGVDPSAQIVVSFDQPLADSVDIAKFARTTGVATTVTRQGNQVIFKLSSAPRCSAMTIVIDKGLKSGVNGLASKDGWSYNTRVNCRATAVIGYSVKGRPIIAYYYGSGSTTILFTGGIHGSEPSSTTTMQAWASHLDSNAPKIPAGKQVVIVPNTNPDGIAARSRYNANNVNLARNFATADWKTDIETSSGTMAGGGGPAPMSEPETRALASITSQVNPRVEVSFHASGRLVGANDYADSRSIGSLYASTVGYSTMFGNSAEDVMGYGFSGQYEDWIGEKLGKPAILIELPSANGNYLSSQLNALWKMVNL